MAEHGQGKLVPPQQVLADRFRTDIHNHLRDTITARILEDADLNASNRVMRQP